MQGGEKSKGEPLLNGRKGCRLEGRRSSPNNEPKTKREGDQGAGPLQLHRNRTAPGESGYEKENDTQHIDGREKKGGFATGEGWCQWRICQGKGAKRSEQKMRNVVTRGGVRTGEPFRFVPGPPVVKQRRRARGKRCNQRTLKVFNLGERRKCSV